MNERYEKIKKAVSDVINVEEETITESSNLIDDLGADSLDIVELVMVLEEEFLIDIDDIQASQWVTVGDINRFINNHEDIF